MIIRFIAWIVQHGAHFDGKIMKYDIIKNGKKLNLSIMAMRSFSEWVKFQKYLNTRRVV